MSRLIETVTCLREHFEALRDVRRQSDPPSPVFALEHPLTKADVSGLAHELGDALKRDRRLVPEHGLGWVVLASECGYEFGGCEFWQSFDQRIADWGWLGDRQALRQAFTTFARDYNGVQPSGQWAAHFSLICWPITHAILPRDLQRHLCEAIYEARYQLSGLRGIALDQLGHTIARTAPWHGTRFDDFLQQHALVGAIVHRLLVDDSDAEHAFRPETFTRILGDLQRISVTRGWLREAGKLYGRRVSIGAPAPPRPAGPGAESGSRMDHIDLVPTLLLEQSTSDQWTPLLCPPSLVAWVQREPDIGRALVPLRFKVATVDDRARPAAGLLAARPAPIALRAFPPLDQPLVEFLPKHEVFSTIFDMDCRLPPHRILVFRQAGDVARLTAHAEVVPGESYLLATQEDELAVGNPVPCADPRWKLYQLQMPGTVGGALPAQLQAAGLHVRRSTRLRPWGLLPRQWDEDMAGEWITTEPIVYVVERDHHFDAIGISIDGSTPTFLECDTMADPTLVLNDLDVGTHHLMVTTLERRSTRSGQEWHEISRGEVTLRVRSPSVWRADHITPDVLQIEVDPPRPTLTQVLRGDLALTIEGTAAAPVSIALMWTDGASGTFTEEAILHQRPPIRGETWHQQMAAFQRRINPARIGLGAHQAFLRVSCDPLGEQRIPVTVIPSPVRWSVRGKCIRLVCDGSHEPKVVYTSFTDPVSASEMEHRACERGVELTQSGLYLAIDGDIHHGVVLGHPGGTLTGFQALGEAIPSHALRSADVPSLLGAIRRWEVAVPLTLHAHTNRQRVLTKLHQEILRRAVGDPWIALETQHPVSWSKLEHAVDLSMPSHSFGYTLGMARAQPLDPASLHERFAEAADAYGVTRDRRLVDAAWQLATQPATLPSHWQLPDESDRLAFARLVRGARLVWLGHQNTLGTDT